MISNFWPIFRKKSGFEKNFHFFKKIKKMTKNFQNFKNLKKFKKIPKNFYEKI